MGSGGPALLNGFEVVEDIVDGADLHGLLLFLAGEGKTEHQLDLAKQFDGVDAVKTMHIPQIIVEGWILELKILDEKSSDFVLQFLSGHDVILLCHAEWIDEKI